MLVVTLKGEKYYACGKCGLIYNSRDIAEKCEEWCEHHRSCSREISIHAIGQIRRAGFRLN